MEPKFCPVCGDSTMKPIRRPKALGGSGEQFSRVKVLAYRCKRGHVFLFGQGDGEKKSAAGAE